MVIKNKYIFKKTFVTKLCFKNILFLFLFFITLNQAESRIRHSKAVKTFQAQILSCHDGDTCRAKYKNETIKIRLAGIDAPEIKQFEGKAAKRQLEAMVAGKEVRLECNGKSYDRLTCVVWLNELEINEEMVKRGFAFDSPKYSKGKYAQAMSSAKSQKVGIWKTILISPFCTRHKNNLNCKTDLLYNQ
jgi:micrococcal nuclease